MIAASLDLLIYCQINILIHYMARCNEIKLGLVIVEVAESHLGSAIFYDLDYKLI